MIEGMNQTLFSLAGFAGWSLLMALLVANFRAVNSFFGLKIPINNFSPSGDNIPGFGQRATRAHLNCMEVLPAFAAVVAVAGFSGQFAIMEGTVIYILYARIAQSVIHLISVSVIMVWLRATFFLIQVFLLLYYIYQICCSV